MDDIPRIAWDDSDSEAEEANLFDNDPTIPDNDHQYMFPFCVGQYTIRTLSDFVSQQEEIHQEFIKAQGEEVGNYLWADLYPSLTAIGDPEEMDAASRDASLTFPLEVRTIEAVTVSQPLEAAELTHLSTSFNHELVDAAAELNLDDPNLYQTKTYFTIDKVETAKRLTIAKSPKVPPLAPLCPAQPPAWLKFCCEIPVSGILPRSLHDPLYKTWREAIEPYIIASELPPVIDDYSDADTVQSLSNCRPDNELPVLLVWADGTELNVGVHAYEIDEDLLLELDFNTADLSLQELFSAPGGEGLTNPTPSHLLHQIASTILSSALQKHCLVIVEENNVDIRAGSCSIDITSSASLWHKELRPRAKNKNQPKPDPIAAVSKYDLVASVLPIVDSQISNILSKAVANCLACEFPASWVAVHDDVATDLGLQRDIYLALADMPSKTLDALGEMCYTAAIETSIPLIKKVDLKAQGTTYLDKASKLLKAVNKLRPRNKIALPPTPASQITALPSRSITVEILGHVFNSQDKTLQRKSAGTKYKMGSCESFLENYPASALVTHSEAVEICQEYDSNYLSAYGDVHTGPCPQSPVMDKELLAHTNHIYAHNGFAQLAEIRSDVVRSIYALPFPRPGVWQQVYVYSGKVSVWYRSRDAPNSPEGYRIDWFGISKFRVLGSTAIKSHEGDELYLWPRQRLRSQEMQLTLMAPRRLKYILHSMLEKARPTKASIDEIALAWNRLAATCVSSTWASGELFKTCRYLSGSLSSPSSPFDSMASKLKRPHNFADILYIHRLTHALTNWQTRDQYHSRCALLDLPRSFAQLESYWMLWIPDEYADTDKHLTNCVADLHTEYELSQSTMEIRTNDLVEQLILVNQQEITMNELRSSLRRSCNLDTGGKLGWSWVGSLAAGHALKLRSSPSEFDAKYGRGTTHKNLASHLTVRHSARINDSNNLEKGTVCEMILANGVDRYLSIITPTYRFLFLNRPTFFNHPKKGEHKDREISITDPDSRIALNCAELTCGHYGKTTRVDFLKEARKDQIFYNRASAALESGGVIQSSDASRYGPMMSNFAIAIMLLYLSTQSMHLRWSAVVYARLAYRVMTISQTVLPQLAKWEAHSDTQVKAQQVRSWIVKMPVIYTDDRAPAGGYCTAMHMGQGMSHHSSSLLHAGGLLASQDAALRSTIVVNRKEVVIEPYTMVTSDDSTLLPIAKALKEDIQLTRQECQIACHIFLKLQRAARHICLRMVSVMPNLAKEIIAGDKGEFNSQDSGIGLSCPILGFREGISLLVYPSAPALIGDYLNAHANAKTVAFSGQGLSSGTYFHALMIDAIEQRWYYHDDEMQVLKDSPLVPNELIQPASKEMLVSSPASWLSPSARGFLLRQSIDKNAESEDLDPHTRDSVYAPLMHAKVSMSKQHRKAIALIRAKIKECQDHHLPHQATMLEEALQSTLSSARTRNLGRVGSRIKLRKITPRPWGDKTFTSETVIHHTLTWIQHLTNLYLSQPVAADDIMLGNAVAGYIKLGDERQYRFPRPPTRRVHIPDAIRKPKFRDSGYGSTPFGMHAIKRSRTVVVGRISLEERRAIQEYLAKKRHRAFAEHITYGSVFVSSWHKGQGQIIIALDITADINTQMMEHVKWGDFTQEGITALCDLQAANPETPVLALHRYSDGRGLWHAVHKGIPYTVYRAVDVEGLNSNFIWSTTSGGRDVILAMQGYATGYEWHGSGPTLHEVESYLEMPIDQHVPDIIRSTEIHNMRTARTQLPTYSSVVTIDSEQVFVHISPDVHDDCYNNASLRPRYRYLRSKVIAELSMAAYWHSALRGVCFRAFMKGHHYDNTIWTGACIGWKMSATNMPTYGTIPLPSTNVRELFCINSVDNPDSLSPFNPDLFGEGVRVVVGSDTLQFSRSIKLNASFISLILACNFGERHKYSCQGSKFLDLHLPSPTAPIYNGTSQEANDEICRLIKMSQNASNEW